MRIEMILSGGSKTIIISIFLMVQTVMAQQSIPCDRALSEAGKAYGVGNFPAAINGLTGCLQTFDKQEHVEACRLISMSEIALNHDEKATEYAMKLLYLKPDYREYPYFDPIEFTRLLSRFDVWNRLEIGIKVGFNTLSFHPVKNYSVNGANESYNSKFGYQAGLAAEYYLKRQFSVGFELLYEGLSYSIESNPITNWKQQYIEKLNYLTLPFTGRYYILDFKNTRIGVELGLQAQILVASSSNILSENQQTGYLNQNSYELLSQRKEAVWYMLSGLTAKQNVGSGTLSLSLRYAYGLTNMNNGDKRYNDINFILSSQHVDSDLRFNPMYLSVSYQFPIPSFITVSKKK